MKKFILTLAIIASSIVTFANDVISTTVLKTFEKEFAGAKEASWNVSGNNYKVNFTYNNQHVVAFYTAQGELLGTARNLTSLELPVSLQRSLKENYSQYWISNLFELSNADGVNYYITIEKADVTVILNSDGTTWNQFRKTTKK